MGNVFGSILMGFIWGFFTAMVIIGLSERGLIDECEANLPRTQHCEIIKTAEVVK